MNIQYLRLAPALIFVCLLGCKEQAPKEQPVVVREDPAKAVANAEVVRKSTPAQLAEGLTLSLWASDSLAPDPVAISIDDEGRVYLTRTNRQKNSEFDIRGHRDWMIPSISLQTVEERRAFLHATFAPEKSKENEWLKDLNNDGSHDWKDLAVEKDEVWRLEDTSGDGIADLSTRILSDFHDEVTDVAGGILVRDEDVFVTIGPDMWRLKDSNGDGVLDQKESISHGYAVHIGFGGHGMSGATEGPDGKIYWQIGDIGANITAVDGKKYSYPNEGVLVRSNPDGSDFEVFASGIRNTHEFVFDEYGNIISSDNDGDHPGESERLVYIVDGSDQGWRSNWQYGKYVDPRNNEYKVWMDEELYKPRWDGQAAYIIPPIKNFHNGPTGMAYNPGTALGSVWKNTFFLVEFVGNPSRSHIWAFKLKPKGASFELTQDVDMISGILPTGIRFGPDGALYVADWINGWNTKNFGRVWKLDVNEDKNDLKVQRAETLKLMKADYAEQSEEALLSLLSNDDMRIRQKAQFELVARGDKSLEVFKKAIGQRDNQLARVHAIWGIGQLARKDKNAGSALVDLLKDADPEIVAQAAKTIGDSKISDGKELIPLLSSDQPRVLFFGAQAIGRLGTQDAVQPLLKMIEKNDDADVYLRHAGVMALVRIGKEEPMVALASSPSKALRTAAVLVLRRLKSEKVAAFLQDKDEYVVAEAARAINDDLSIEKALPALAAVLNEKRFTAEPLLRRAINACLRVGGEKEMDMVIAFANRNEVSPELRGEALATLGVWANPSTLDRVDGRVRGKIERNPEAITAKVRSLATPFLQSKDPAILVATSKMISSLGITDFNDNFAKIMQQSSSTDVRSAMLLALSSLRYDKIESVIEKGMQDKDPAVRTTAVGLLSELNITKENLPSIVDPIFKKGSVQEQQELLKVLGEMPVEKSESVLNKLLDQLAAKKLTPAITLDLAEAIDSTHSEKLIAKFQPLRPIGNKTDGFKDALLGGDSGRAWWYFRNSSSGQCVRCHSINNEGGTVGPNLSEIGDKLTREEILTALIEPSARLSPGFGSVKLTLKDGQIITGILIEESKDEITLKTSDAEPVEVSLSRIEKRENMTSAMPPMGTLMSKREIRDMVEYLSNQKAKK